MRAHSMLLIAASLALLASACKSKPSPSGTAVVSSSVPTGTVTPPPPPPEVKVDAVVCKTVKDGEAVEASDHFARATPAVHAVWHANFVKAGTTVTGNWYQDGGAPGARPYKLMEKGVVLDGPSGAARGDLSLSPPPEGWPAGAFHLDVLFDGEKVATVAFHVE